MHELFREVSQMIKNIFGGRPGGQVGKMHDIKLQRPWFDSNQIPSTPLSEETIEGLLRPNR